MKFTMYNNTIIRFQPKETSIITKIQHKTQGSKEKFQSSNKKAINFIDENLTSKTSQNLDFMFVLWEHDNRNGEDRGR